MRVQGQQPIWVVPSVWMSLHSPTPGQTQDRSPRPWLTVSSFMNRGWQYLFKGAQVPWFRL